MVNSYDESMLHLFKRANNSVTTWTDAMGTLNTASKTITTTGQSTEYILGVASGTLPVSLLNFSAYRINAAVQLTWRSENEINFSGYEIERSTDGLSFNTIGQTSAEHAANINSYSFTDNSPVAGNNFYRLKQINSDGNDIYSKIVSVNFSKKIIITITPNPVQRYLNINSSTSIKEIN